MWDGDGGGGVVSAALHSWRKPPAPLLQHDGIVLSGAPALCGHLIAWARAEL